MSFLGALGWFLTLFVEPIIGKRKPMDAASSLELLWTVLAALVARFRKPKGASMSIAESKNPNARYKNVPVDGPTDDAMGIIVDATKKYFSGEKTQQIVGEEIGAAMSQLSAMQSIPADATADLATVENAIAVRMVELGEVIRKGRLAPPPVK